MNSWKPYFSVLFHAIGGAVVTGGTAYLSGSPVDWHTLIGGLIAVIFPLFSTPPSATR